MVRKVLFDESPNNSQNMCQHWLFNGNVSELFSSVLDLDYKNEGVENLQQAFTSDCYL